VLVAEEIFGVHDHIMDVCRRLAKLGSLAIAPLTHVRARIKHNWRKLGRLTV
jgi:carboxymethylenebutenolidase